MNAEWDAIVAAMRAWMDACTIIPVEEYERLVRDAQAYHDGGN
jgi:hypothetical protein